MNYKDLKMGQKIISGFLLVAFIALVIGVTGMIGMNGMGTAFNNVATVKMSSVYYLGEMNIAAERVYGGYVKLIDPKLSRAEREQILQAINGDRLKLEEAIGEFEELDLSEEEARLYKEVSKVIAEWANINNRITQLHARFMEIDLMNPTLVVSNIQMFMKDHYELQLKAFSSISNRMYFEGGDNAEACNFGVWMKGFSTQNASFNAGVRDMRAHHDHFHESVHQIKNLTSQGKTEPARKYYQDVMQPEAKSVFGVFKIILEESERATALLQEISNLISGESAEHYKIFNEKFNQLKDLNRQDASNELELGTKTFRFSNILIILTIIIGLAISVMLSIFLTRNITKGLNKGVVFAEKISKGDLTVDLDQEVLQQKDEVGQLARALQNMVEQLKKIIQDVLTSTDNITSASQQMSSGSMELSQGASIQASSAEEISSSMEEMVANIQQNTDNARQTEKIAIQSANGIRKVSENAMASNNAIKEIASKISIIGDIAYKTNILALNAAVEAARAGEHGQGFAVVADEVRKLAERSQIAADEIDLLSLNSVNMADEAGKQLVAIVPDIEKTARLVQEIAAASMEQNSGADQINSAIQQLNTVIQQNAAASEEMASSSEELSSQADQMKEVISYFVVDHHQQRVVQAKKAPNRSNSVGEMTQSRSHGKSKAGNKPGVDLNIGDMGFNAGDFESF